MSGGFGADLSGLMRQAQQMQKDVEKVKAGLAEMVVEATAGGDAIRVHANGVREVLSVKIKPEVIDPDDPEELEDLVLTAVNNALTKAQELADKEMGKATGGFNLPGLFG